MERKTRLELATLTLARLCSTNWATFAFCDKWQVSNLYVRIKLHYRLDHGPRVSMHFPTTVMFATSITFITFYGERSKLPLHFTNFSFALASEIHDCLFPQHILNNTFLVVTLPPLTSFILNTSAVLGWCSFIRDASKQRVSSFSQPKIVYF